MPYVRRSRRSRRFRRRASRKTIAKIVKSVFNKNVENKYQTYDLTTFGGISTGGSLININVLSQGTAVTQRVGNRVKFTSIRFKGTFGFADADNVTRMMVLWARAPLDVADMPTVHNPINPAEQNYKCLFDRTVVTDSNAASGIRYLSVGTIFRKINGNSTYDNNTTTPSAGFLYVYFVSDSGATPNPTFTGQAIISYQDA